MLKRLPGFVGRFDKVLQVRSLAASATAGGYLLPYCELGQANGAVANSTLGATTRALFQPHGTFGSLRVRSYSSGPVNQAKSLQNVTGLQNVLSNEIMEEAADDAVDSELEVIKEEIMKSFTIEDSNGNGVVTLKGKYKNEEITVMFDCQDESEESAFNEDFMEKFDKSGGENEDGSFDDMDDEDYDDDMKYGINFTASIKKKNGEIIFDCVADESIKINHVRIQKDSDSAYKGPPFENLSDSLQEAFMNYLEDRKINPDLCHFILLYSQYKEQKEYVNWLKNLSEFTA